MPPRKKSFIASIRLFYMITNMIRCKKTLLSAADLIWELDLRAAGKRHE